LGTGWYEKDYTTYGYEFGTLAQRLDLFDANLRRIEDRLAKLNPAPLRPVPILIGGGGERRTLPAVARHAHISHIYPSGIADYRRKSTLVDELAEAHGRLGGDIERSVGWTDEVTGEEYLRAGVTLFTVSIRPTEQGFDFTALERLLLWRDTLSG
jgi:alkanesulfonate monooxygenase SsuD/methylene tetrahydromethanopterin reductase-like flavin-dependent oxidoreductase (luciferase family)